MERISPEINQPIQSVVRSLVVSLAPAEEIYNSFKRDQKTSILRFVLGIKGEGEDKRYTLLGGKLDESEKWQEAIQREVGEEVGVRFLGLPYQTQIGEWEYSSQKSDQRRVILTYNPISPCSQITIGDPKIRNVGILSLTGLKQLIKDGSLDNVPIEGHLTINNEKDPINISEENNKKKNSSLSKALNWMEYIENYLQKYDITYALIKKPKKLS